jgi:tetratricopeptide (TPR) repeat protein
MELFYNPERMSETEIKETFVAYQWLVDEIVAIIKRQPKGAGVQHVVIVAPRGMGKTTMLLMLRFTVLSQDLAKCWQPVLFPEESYSVYDLADLWVEVLDHIASETGDVALREGVKKLKEAHPNSSSLEAVALASIKDWRDKNKKRLLLLVDNFDMILEQIGDEKDNASLRDVLMNDGTMMLVGGSTTFFKEARAYDQPLYNLFKIYNLNGLDSDQMEDLLRRRAKLDGIENFEEILRANRSRLRVLEYFTGGNPRLVLMLYRVLTHSDISEVRRGLEKLLDEVTPYYKAKVEALPPQQRKILDQIARISAQTREGLTPTEIASATRLAVNHVSSQLKRLADVGYVRAANIRGRSSYYTLSEPLYAIWHQMRFARDTRTRMKWLIAFLKGWYDADELGVECQRLQDVFREYLNAGREKDARNALEHRRYLMEAIDDQQSRINTFESIILSYLELSDVDTLKEDILANIDVSTLSEGTRLRLLAAGLTTEEGVTISIGRNDIQAERASELDIAIELVRTALKEKKYVEAANVVQGLEKGFPENSPQLYINRALQGFLSQNDEECLANLEAFLQKEPAAAFAWGLKGLALQRMSSPEEAVVAFNRAVEIDPNHETLSLMAEILNELDRKKEALAKFDNALQIKPDYLPALIGRAWLLEELGRTNEALSVFDSALSTNPDAAELWFERAKLLKKWKRMDEALKSFDRALELNPNSYQFLYGKCRVLSEKGQLDEALDHVNRLLQVQPESADAYLLRGMLMITKDFEAAMRDLKYAFAFRSSSQRELVDGIGGRSSKIIFSVIAGDLDNVKNDWQELVHHARQQDQTRWLKVLSQVATFLAESGQWALTRELISSANLDQPLFPLARALDYLIGRDETIIEKLSPEIRTIVEEIVRKFKKASVNKPASKSADKRSPARKAARRKVHKSN